MNEFKELILSKGYSSRIKYKLKNETLDDNYFNNNMKILEISKCYVDIKDYPRYIAILLYLSYNKPIYVFMDGKNHMLMGIIDSILQCLDEENTLLLIKEFMKTESRRVRRCLRSEEEIYIYDENPAFFNFIGLVDHLFRFKGNFDSAIDWKLLNRIVLMVDTDKKYNELFNYLIDNFRFREHIFDVDDDDIIIYFLDILIDRGEMLNKRYVYNCDTLLKFAFIDMNERAVEHLSNKLSSISSDKLDNDIIKEVILTETGDLNYVPLEIIQHLSKLENFEDFVNNNKYVLMKILDEEALKYIESYL